MIASCYSSASRWGTCSPPSVWGGQIDVEEVQALTVTRPDGSLKTLQRGTLTLVALQLPGPNFCADPTVAFVGTGRVLYTDNDVFVTGTERTRARSG